MDSPAILSLCSGYGGLDLAVEAVTGGSVECYVERELGAAGILAARMEEGSLARAPVWSDLHTFPAGRMDRSVFRVVTAGFPCQPWSVAGSRKGTADDRWIWPRIAEIIADCGARDVYLENVGGLVSGGGLELVLGGLSDLGFDAKWGCLRVSDLGGSHHRNRVFIYGKLADHDGAGCGLERVSELQHGERAPRGHDTNGRDQDVGAASGSRLLEYGRERKIGGSGRGDGEAGSQLGIFPPSPESPDWPGIIARWPHLAPATKSSVHVVADGHAFSLDDTRAHALRAAGNGVVVAQAAAAFTILRNRTRGRH